MGKFFRNSVVIDGSYMIHRCLKTPELWDMQNSSGIRTGGVVGFLKSLGYAIKPFRGFPIICWDAGQSPRRLEAYPNYKKHLERAIRTKADKIALMLLNRELENLPEGLSEAERVAINEAVQKFNAVKMKYNSFVDPDDYVSQYHRQRDMIISICHSFGIPSVRIAHWEGDDLVTLVTRMSEKSVVVSDDRDMIQLISPNVSIYRVMKREFLEYEKHLQKEGVRSPREFVIAKAIAGDASDNIPSVTGNEASLKYRVGEANAKKIARVISEANEIPTAYLPVLLSIEGKDKNKIEGFVRNHDSYLRNLVLVDLSLVEDNPEAMNGIIAEVRSYAGRGNMLEALAKLGELEADTVDVNSLLGKIQTAYKENFGQ